MAYKKNPNQQPARQGANTSKPPGKPGKPNRNRGQQQGQGGGGSVAAGDRYAADTLNNSNFDGRNDYLSTLWNNVSNANFDEGMGYLRDFLGGGSGGGSAAGGGGRPTYYGGGYATAGPGGVQAAGYNSGGKIPDTMQQGGWVADRIKEMWDAAQHPENDPTLQPYIETLKKNALMAAQQQRSALDSRAEGSGRYGSGYYAAQTANDARASGDSLDSALASTMLNARSQNMDRATHGFDTANERDLAAMADMTNRYGIDAQERASSNASGASSALAQNAQRLDAIQMMMGMDQFGLNMQNNIGNSLNDVQMGALNSATSRYNSNNSLRAAAMGANAERYASDNSLAGTRYASDAGLRGTMAGVNERRYEYNDQKPQNSLDSLLRTIGLVGGMGGTNFSQGAPPYGGFDPSSILAMMGGGR